MVRMDSQGQATTAKASGARQAPHPRVPKFLSRAICMDVELVTDATNFHL